MSDPLARGASRAPATLGEGCLSRYDLADLTGEQGADFAAAAELWQQLQTPAERAAEPEPLKSPSSSSKPAR
jgi:hypothetical protein